MAHNLVNECVDAAQRYIAHGFSGYPAQGNKKALIRGWNRAAAARDSDTARRYFETYPEAQVGIATGPSRLVVIDVDPRNDGDASFRQLCSEVGLETFERCPTVVTPSGGRHIYFRAPNKPIRCGEHVLGAGVDVKGEGGGVLAPPSKREQGKYSRHTSGGEFPDFGQMPALPDTLAERIQKRIIKKIAASLPATIAEGDRNSTLFRVGCRLAKLGATVEMIQTALTALNAQHCKPPLPEEEIRVISGSASHDAAIDPARWFQAWAPKIEKPTLFKIAAIYSNVAEFSFGPLTPRTQLVTRLTGIESQHFYPARRELAELGANRGALLRRAQPARGYRERVHPLRGGSRMVLGRKRAHFAACARVR